jgi:hypothetical protein
VHSIVASRVFRFASLRPALICLTLIMATASDGASLVAADGAGKKPATVAEAAKIIDFSRFPVMPEVENPGRRRIAGLSCEVKSTVAGAFEYHKRKLTADKWKELPSSFSSEQSASSTFARDGYVVSLSVTSLKPGTVLVSLTNHGNVDVQKLPLPKGAKPLYAFAASAAFVTAESVESTAAELRKLLTAQGWQPYGTAGDSQIFKQNAVRLNARAARAPAQGGKTVIDYSTDLMSVDLPAPAETINLQYSDSTAQLLFDTAAGMDEIVSFYRKVLKAPGWEATTDKPFKSDFRDTLIFRNPAKDMLTLEMYTVDEKLRVSLKYQTAAEIAELKKQIEAEAERRKKAKTKEPDKPQARLALKLPAGAKGVKAGKDSLEFTVAAGKAKAAAEDLRKQIGKSGWKEKEATLEEMSGSLIFTKDNQILTVVYVDTGFMPAELTISGPGVEPEK